MKRAILIFELLLIAALVSLIVWALGADYPLFALILATVSVGCAVTAWIAAKKWPVLTNFALGVALLFVGALLFLSPSSKKDHPGSAPTVTR